MPGLCRGALTMFGAGRRRLRRVELRQTSLEQPQTANSEPAGEPRPLARCRLSPPPLLLPPLTPATHAHPPACDLPVLDREEYVALRRELAELKAEAAAARGGSRGGQRVSLAAVMPGSDCCAAVNSFDGQHPQDIHFFKSATPPACHTAPHHRQCSPAPPHPHMPQLESSLVRAARDEAAARESELRKELEAAQAAGREHLERAARARRAHERCAGQRAAALGAAATCLLGGGRVACCRAVPLLGSCHLWIVPLAPNPNPLPLRPEAAVQKLHSCGALLGLHPAAGEASAAGPSR